MKRNQTIREKYFQELESFLSQTVVISEITKERIRKAFLDTDKRFDNESGTKLPDYFVEYHALEKELKLLNIFSNDFYTKIFNIWHGFSYSVVEDKKKEK